MKVGSSASLTCSYESNLDDTQVTWIRLSDHGILTNEKTFEIVEATLDQSGLYKCRVTNRVCKLINENIINLSLFSKVFYLNFFFYVLLSNKIKVLIS